MISGSNDKELELATARADILLMCGSETIKIIDKEISRLNNIIDELEKYTIEQINIVKKNMQIIGNEGKRMATRFVVYNEYLDKLKELKEGKEC